MSAHSALTEELKGLEEQLLDQTVRRSADRVSALLSDDFIEIGASGRMFDKADIICALASEAKHTEKLTISEFQLRSLSLSLAQTLYRIAQTNTRRASIWRRTESGWRMVFHQGTRMSPADGNVL